MWAMDQGLTTVRALTLMVRSAERRALICVVLSLLFGLGVPVAMAVAQTAQPQPGEPPAVGAKPKAGAARGAANLRRGQPGTLTGHGGPVKALGADTEGRRVLTGSFDYSLMIWDVSVETPRMMQRMAAFEGAVNAVAFVPGGDLVVGGGDDAALWVWRIGDEKPIARLPGHQGKINAISVSADGSKAVSSSWDRTARVWDLKALKAGAVLDGHKGPVNAAVFSQDGTRVYTASYDGTIVAWNAIDGTRLRTVYSHGWGVNVLALVPGRAPEKLVFGALNGHVGVLDAGSGREVATLPGHERPVLSLAVTAKPGLLAIGSGDGVIRVLRLGDWALVEEFHNNFGPIWAIAFVAEGTALYYGSLDDFALRWQIAPRAQFEPVESQFPRRFQVGDGLPAGERQFARKCSVCHTLVQDGRNRAGPTLFGVFGRKAGTVRGYPYSDALKGSSIVWNEETIGKLFELGPDHFTPGSKMPLQRIADAPTREALIAYLKIATLPPDGDKTVRQGAGGGNK